MTISGTDIRDEYGLRLIKLTDYYNLPARKPILNVPAFEENDIKYEPRKAVMKLFGKYDDQDEMATKIEGFKTLIKSATDHTIVIGARNITIDGVFAEGIKVDVRKSAVIIDIVVTLLET
jgi:hypothetical protein